MFILRKRYCKTDGEINSCKIPHDAKVCVHQPGIEPGALAWQARILPLNH